MAGSCQHLKPDESPSPFSPFHEGISMLLSRWTALQMAVQNQWGGRDSFMKSQQLAYEINSWFSQPKGTECESFHLEFDSAEESNYMSSQVSSLHQSLIGHTANCIRLYL